MNKIKRLLLLLLTLALLLGALACFAGCDKDKGKEEGTTVDNSGVTDETDNGYRDDLPSNLKFENEEIKFLIGEVSSGLGGTFAERSIAIDGYAIGDAGTNTVDEQVYYRNLDVEDRLGVIISPHALSTAVTGSILLNDLRSGTSEYDVISAYQIHDIPMATEGLILNFNAMSQHSADYVDISKEYWDKSYSEALSYNNAMYWVTGDLSLSYLGGKYCTFVNLDLYNDALKDTYGDIYTLVENKGWNLDVMATMIEQIAVSADDVWDETDTLGFVIENADQLDGMSIGAGVKFSVTNEAGEISIALSDTKTYPAGLEFAKKMWSILYDNNKGTYMAPFKHSANSLGLFSQGTVLFTHNKILLAEIYLTEMESYGIIPSPMLNEAQGTYYAAIHDSCSMYGIYSQSSQIAAAAATLEAMASMSEAIVTAYYDEALKYRYSRDPESAKMVDLISDSVYIDFAFAWGKELNNIHNFYRTFINEDKAPSNTSKYKNSWNVQLQKLLTALVNQSGLTTEE